MIWVGELSQRLCAGQESQMDAAGDRCFPHYATSDRKLLTRAVEVGAQLTDYVLP
jgi:hypothetical protein